MNMHNSKTISRHHGSITTRINGSLVRLSQTYFHAGGLLGATIVVTPRNSNVRMRPLALKSGNDFSTFR